MSILELYPTFQSDILEKYEFEWEIPDWENICDDEAHVTSRKLIFETLGDASLWGLQTRWLIGLKKVQNESENNTYFARLYWQLLDIKGRGIDKEKALSVKVETRLFDSIDDQDYSDVKRRTIWLGDTIEETSYENLEICNDDRFSDTDPMLEFDRSIKYSLVLTIEKDSIYFLPRRIHKTWIFSKGSAQLLSENLGAILKDVSSSDIKIVTSDGVEFPAHKLILKARCPVFAGMFNADLKENKNGIVEATDISGKTMEILLTYFYSGELLPNYRDNNVIVEFTYAAGKYQMSEVLQFLNSSLGDPYLGKPDATYVDVQLLNLTGKLSLVNAEKRLFDKVLFKINRITKSDQLFELFGIEKNVILEKAKELLDASTVLKIWSYALGNMEYQATFDSNILLVLALVSSDSTMNHLEKDLLKRLRETLSRVSKPDQLFEIMRKY